MISLPPCSQTDRKKETHTLTHTHTKQTKQTNHKTRKEENDTTPKPSTCRKYSSPPPRPPSPRSPGPPVPQQKAGCVYRRRAPLEDSPGTFPRTHALHATRNTRITKTRPGHYQPPLISVPSCEQRVSPLTRFPPRHIPKGRLL